MVAADVPVPDMIGDDIFKDGRVVGMMELVGHLRKSPSRKKRLNMTIELFTLNRAKPRSVKQFPKCSKSWGIQSEHNNAKRVPYDIGCMKSLRKLPDRVTAKFMDMMTRYMSDPSASGAESGDS